MLAAFFDNALTNSSVNALGISARGEPTLLKFSARPHAHAHLHRYLVRK
jgi:hypothetical protein